MESGYDDVISRVRSHRPDANIVGILVERMHRKRYELLVGAKRDPIFGPLLVFGQGGVAVEVIRDTNFALPPLNMALARHLVSGTSIHEQLEGFRGIPPVDLEELAFHLVKFAYVLMDFPEVAEMDVNPLLMDEHGAIVLDARIILDEFRPRRKERPFHHLVISPYPEKYTRRLPMKDGREVLLRPIRPEDEPMEADMLKTLSDQSLYFRFFGYVPKLTHDFLTRMTHIDYDREMALVAELEEQGGKQMVGVTRIIADAWGETAEFAILVADPWQHMGLGSSMFDYMLEIARDKGIRKIVASVLRSNAHMITMFRSRGFELTPEEDNIYSASLDLEHAIPFATDLPFQPW
ncbi:MAG: hypothetical protein RLY31_239 [Bacteroidota bacterium]